MKMSCKECDVSPTGWSRVLALCGLLMLDVPGLELAVGQGVRVGIHHFGFRQVHLVA